MKSNEKKGLQIRVDFEGKPQEKLKLAAYVFNSKGQLVEKAPLKDEKLSLNQSASHLKHQRLFIAPVSNEENKEESPSLMDMVKRSAYEPAIEGIDKNFLELKSIPEFNWRNWCWISCRVRGKVVKPIPTNDGSVNMPVCRARVHICEVDRLHLILPIIPDDILIDLRDIIINPPLPDPFPIPFPEPDPLPFNPRIEKFQSLDLNVKKAFSVDSPNLIRKAVLDNFVILHPYLCLVPRFWPYFYRCDELKTVLTDHQGRFDTSIYYPCGGDKPDLYFWVEYFIDDAWTTVYKPSIPCHTYWNYNCGSEVSITVTHPGVDICGELPGPEGSDSVEIIKIGNGGYVSHINQVIPDFSVIQGEMLRTVGLTDMGLGAAIYKRPFGGNLGFRINFGSSYPIQGGITHYRWSYRKRKDAKLQNDLSAWRIMSTPTHIRYYEENGANFIKKAYPLGPDPDYGVLAFKIPPRRAENIDVPNPQNLDRSWVLEEWNSAILNTFFNGLRDIDRLDDAGLYEFKFELLEKDGNSLRVAIVDKDNFQTPQFDNVNKSENAANVNLILAPGNKASGFTMLVRIDNNRCKAEIYPAKVNNQPANECGFVQYGNANVDEVTLSFMALHPNNFANLSFKVRKGTEVNLLGNPVYRESTNAMVIGNTPELYIRALNSAFSKNVKINTLLGTCTDAAYGEHLYVDALATNGSSFELGYDASILAGFALQKQ